MRPPRSLVILVAVLAAPSFIPLVQSADPIELSAPWLAGPLDNNGIPASTAHHFRVLLKVTVPSNMLGTANLPVTATIRLADALVGATPAAYPQTSSGSLKGFRLDLDSIRVYEVDAEGNPSPSPGPLPALAFPGAFDDPEPYDAELNPTITLSWILRGPTTGPRYFHAYFDTAANGPKSAASAPSRDVRDLLPLAAAVGPGRGTQLYVAIHGRVPTLPNEPRIIDVTNQQNTAVNVQIFRYDDFGAPEPTPVATFVIPGPAGSLRRFSYPRDYAGDSMLLRADGIITAEATSLGTASGFVPGTTGGFLPSTAGGYVGDSFAFTPSPSTGINVFCPAAIQTPTKTSCSATLIQGTQQTTTTVGLNSHAGILPVSGQPALLRAGPDELLLVQRQAPAAQPTTQRGFTAWPPVDGPATASIFFGHAPTTDKLAIGALDGTAAILVKDLAGARQTLADAHPIPQGLWTEAPNEWGVRWDRGWTRSDDPQTTRVHADGPVRIQRTGGTAPLTVLSGPVSSSSALGAIVPIQSPDGGLTHAFHVPADSDGIAVGRLVLFSPYEGAAIDVARRHGGSTTTALSVPATREHERIEVPPAPGTYTITSTLPITALWTKLGTQPASGLGVGIVRGPTVEVLGAQVAGFLFDMEAERAFITAQPGSFVEFAVHVRNLAHTATGTPVADTIDLNARTPRGWDTATPNPPTIVLEPNGQATTVVGITVPPNPPAGEEGASVRLEATSRGQSTLKLSIDLRINYQIRRDVLVTVDDLTTQIQKSVAQREVVVYDVAIINTGGVPDQYSVEFTAPSDDWTFQFQCLFTPTPESPCPTRDNPRFTTPTMNSQGRLNVLVTVGPKEGSAAAFRLVTSIVARSQADSSISAGARFVTSIFTEHSFRLELSDPVRAIAPGNTTTFHVRIINEADTDEELQVTPSAVQAADWGAPEYRVRLAGQTQTSALESLSNKIPIPALSEAGLEILVQVPLGAPAHQMAAIRAGFASTVSPSTPTRELSIKVVATEILGATIAPDQLILNIEPGRSASLNLTLQSKGNVDQTFEVTPLAKHAATGTKTTSPTRGAGPWTIRLTPGATTSLPIRIEVPSNAPPSEAIPASFVFTAFGRGVAAQSREVHVRIPEVHAARLETLPAVVKVGAPNNFTLGVTNLGNVPLVVQAATDLPAGWSWTTAAPKIRPGEHGFLQLSIRLAPDASTDDASLEMRILEATTGKQLDRQRWSLDVQAAHVRTSLAKSVLLNPENTAYTYEVTNDGDATAFRVRVELLENGKPVDWADFQEVPVGSTQVATLIGTSDPTRTSLRITAAHDPHSAPLEIKDVAPPPPPPKTPSVGLALALTVLAALAATRRRRTQP